MRSGNTMFQTFTMGLIGLLLGATSEVWALAIDEKLPLRILKVSDTKKTLLINRGLEDGLVEGDHAKFFLTTGVVARGVAVKMSPTRSVWSVYRVVSADAIETDKVMNLKIATPVKVTEDESKMIYPEDRSDSISIAQGDASGRRLKLPKGVPVGSRDGREMENSDISDEGFENEQAELANFKEKDDSANQVTESEAPTHSHSAVTARTLEIWGMLHLNALSSSTTTEDTSSTVSYAGKLATSDLSLGLEKYFRDVKKWYNAFSLAFFVHSATQESSSVSGQTVSSDILELGPSIYWHFSDTPLLSNKIIWFTNFSAGLGTTKDTFKNSADTSDNQDLSGNLNFFSIGLGIKYWGSTGIGLRAIVDYYRRSESFNHASVDGTRAYKSTKTVSGPRAMLGISYRW